MTAQLAQTGFYYGPGRIGWGLDPTYVLILLALVISSLVSAKMNATFSRYSKVRAYSGLTGAQAAQRILDLSGIYDVRIERIGGSLTDHYDPANKVLRLSDSVYGSASIAAIGVAAHECGHAIQHDHGYVPLNIRSSLVPVVNFASNMSWIFIMLGFVTRGIFLKLGIILFSASVLFQIVTLPVEFNASSRALTQLRTLGIVDDREVRQSRKVLQAAALTYVAAAVTAILQLLRLVLIANSRDD